MTTAPHYAWSADEGAVKRLIPLPGVTDGRCSFCGGAFARAEDAWLEFFDAPTMRGPKDWCTLTAKLAHADCGPDVGYTIALPRLLRDGIGDEPTSWRHHLRGKPWFCASFEAELEAAYALARRLARPVRSPSATRNPRSISAGTRTRVLERDGFRCRRCGATPAHARLVLDHVVPVARGGTADDANLQTLCEPCNQGKSDRAPHPHDLETR